MPRYDFRCAPCQWTFEVTIPFGSDELPPCPQCGKKAAERVISPPLGIHFHGSGFYKTDSRPVEKAKPPAEKGPAPAPHPPPERSDRSDRAGNPLPVRPGQPDGPKGEGTPKAPATDKKVV